MFLFDWAIYDHILLIIIYVKFSIVKKKENCNFPWNACLIS